MGTTLKPASPEQTATRRKELFFAYETKVFAELRKGKVPVKLVAPLGDRSEIFLGLRLAGEDATTTRKRIVLQFVQRHPALSSSAAIDASV